MDISVVGKSNSNVLRRRAFESRIIQACSVVLSFCIPSSPNSKDVSEGSESGSDGAQRPPALPFLPGEAHLVELST